MVGGNIRIYNYQFDA